MLCRFSWQSLFYIEIPDYDCYENVAISKRVIWQAMFIWTRLVVTMTTSRKKDCWTGQNWGNSDFCVLFGGREVGRTVLLSVETQFLCIRNRIHLRWRWSTMPSWFLFFLNKELNSLAIILAGSVAIRHQYCYDRVVGRGSTKSTTSAHFWLCVAINTHFIFCYDRSRKLISDQKTGWTVKLWLLFVGKMAFSKCVCCHVQPSSFEILSLFSW